jgi:diguanylate cyclase (GGDEF)-like protein
MGDQPQPFKVRLAALALELVPAEAAVLGPGGVVVATNPRWQEGGGAPVGAFFVAGEDVEDDELRMVLEDGVARVLDGRATQVELEVPSRVSESIRWNLLLLGAVGDHYAVVIKVDVTRSHEVLDLVGAIAMHDGMTGLPNRSLLEDRIASAIARTERGVSAPLVLFMDLDGFKAVNDAHGHGVGDRVLVAVAQRLSTSLRAADSFGRWGGDEFVAIVEVGPGEGEAAFNQVVDRITESVSAPLRIDGIDVRVGVSIGAVLVQPGDDVRGLVAFADAAMYRAKQSRHRGGVGARPEISARAAPDQPPDDRAPG